LYTCTKDILIIFYYTDKWIYVSSVIYVPSVIYVSLCTLSDVDFTSNLFETRFISAK